MKNIDPTAVASLIASVLALIASIIGIWASWRVAKFQANSSRSVAIKQIIAPMRQGWIDSLRNRLAELLSEISEFREEHGDDKSVRRILTTKWQVELMLNPTEGKHRELIFLLDEAIHLASSQTAPEQFSAHLDKTVASCRSILKEEWVRVKSGDL